VSAARSSGLDYWAFDAVALGLPLLLLAGRRAVRPALRALARPVALVAAVALVWTVPWDRRLVLGGVWSYAPGRVAATVAGLPVEELAFVLLQVALVAAWGAATGLLPSTRGRGTLGSRSGGAFGWGAVALVGTALAVAGGRATYLGLVLAWVAPPLALQHGVAGDLLGARRGVRAALTGPVALWLCVADRVAIGAGTWSIGTATSSGMQVLGLPVEELLFFALTCLLVTDALVLASCPEALARARALARRRVRSPA
jgi:lycopene cyclase domain-containing protein